MYSSAMSDFQIDGSELIVGCSFLRTCRVSVIRAFYRNLLSITSVKI